MHATVHTTHSPRALRVRHSPLALALAACLSAAPVAGLAQVSANQLPTGGSIAGGTGTINAPSGANLSIDQTSTRMALNWSTFDIGSAATVTFNQPSSSAAVLNLIQGGNPTQIFGNLNANGQVFLINTNGMIFGSTAQINVGGLVASTLGTTASGFMSGNDILDAGGNTVALMSNGGTINAAAGAVDLIGGKVVNSGTITASAGNINLVGADQVTLTFETGGFGVVVNKALQLQLDTLAVDNSGSLIAPGGIITLQARAARGVFDQLINNSGIIRAAAISGSDGSVSLVANGAGGVGIAGSGSINVGTGTLLLSSSSSVQQSGVLTTGDLQATTTGNLTLTGSNQIAQVSGTVGGALSLTNARDLSQNSSLEVDGTSAFALGTNALTLNQANDFKNTVGISAGATSISDVNALTLGTLSTGALTVSNSGALNLGSGSAASIAANSGNGAISQTGALTIAGSSVVNAGTGAITLNNADNDFQGAVGLTGRVTQVRDKNALQLGSLSTGALTVRNSGGLNLGSGSAASLDANSGNGAISQNGALSVTGTSSINAGSAGIALTNAANNFGAGVSLTGTGIALTDSNDLIVSSVTGGSNGAIALTAGGVLTLPAQNLDTGTADLSLRANGGALTTAGTLSGRNISLTGNQGITLAHNVGSTGTLALTSGNSAIVQTAGALTAGTTTTVNAGTGAITLDNLGNDFRSGVSLTGTGITLRDSNDLSIAALTGGSNGSIVLSAGGALSLPTQNLDTGTANLSLRANGGALSTAGTLRGNAIELSARDGLTLGHDITATGGLGLSTAGSAINQTGGTLGVAGLSTIDAGGGNITLSSAGNDFQGAVTLAGNAVQIRDANTLTLASVSTGALSATSNGALTLGGGSASSITAASNGGAIAQTGALTVGNTGASTFNAGTGSITLDNAGNDFQGALSLTGTGIGVRDSNDLVVSALNGGANGAIALTAAGTLSLPAQNIDTGTGALSLIANGGALSTAGALSGGNVSLRARDGLDLDHGITASGTLGLTASTGAITQGAGVLDVGGLTTVDAGTSAITLERDNDFRNGIALTGRNIAVVDANDLSVNALTNSGIGNISLTARGSLSLPATGLNAGSGTLALRADTGTLTLGGDLTGNAISLSSGNALTLGSNITSGSGALSVSTNNRAINQTAGALTIGGTSSFNAGTGSISLGSADNHFTGAVTLSGRATLVRDSGALTLGTLSTGALTVIGNGSLTLGSGSADSIVAVSNGNAIAQSGALTVRQASTLVAGGGSITLDQAGNDFQGGLSLTGAGITLRDANDLAISALTSNNNGNIALTAGGTLTLPAQDLNNGSGDITLIANGGGLSTGGTLSGRNLTLRASDGVTLGHNISATEALSLSSNNNAINQTAGSLNVGALTTVDAGTGNITLGNTANTFAGAVNLTGGNVQIAANALTLGALSTNALTASSNGALNLGSGSVRGALNATGNNAGITQTGALSVGGVAALNAGTGAITLTNANNDFIDAVSVTAGNVAIADRNALTLGNVSAGALTVSSVGDLNLGTGSIATTLSATTSNNAITQTGPLTVGGASVLNAGTGAITLRNAANVFQGALSLTGGITQIDSGAALTLGTLSTGALTISNNGALTLGSGRVASLAASSSGNAIAQSGALEVGGPTNLNAGTANISLVNTANDFGDTVTLTAGDARVTDRNALTLGTLATGSLTATSVGALNLGSGTIGGTLTATSNNGAINQSGALTVAGTSVLNAGSGSITLTDANNTLQGAVDLVGAATQLRNNTALTLGSIGTGGLDVSSNGALNLGSGRAASLIASSNGNAITQAGALAVVGNSRLDAGANSITLTNAGNDFAGAVSLIGGAAQLADSNALTLNTLDTGALTLASGGALTLGTGTVDGALTSSANGAIGQNGALTITGTSSFAAGNNAITLNNAGNDFRDTVSLTGGVTEIVDRNDLALGSLATAALTATGTGALNLGSGTINGALNVQSNNGALTQGGVLSVAGTSTLNAGSGTITLNNAGNAFAGAVNLTGGDVQIGANALTLGALSTSTLTATSAGALNLGSGNVRGTLTGTSGNAAITQTGALSVNGASTLNAGSGNIALAETSNDFVGALALTGNAIAVQDRNDLSIAALQSGPNAAVSLVAGGGLNLPVSQIDTGNGALTLTANGGSLRTNGTLRGGDVQLTGNNGIELTNAITATNTLSLNSTNAAITQRGGALLVAGNTAVNAGNGAITLDAAGNDFQGVLALSGGASSVRDANGLTLGALNTGNLQVTNNGALNLGVGLVNGDLLAASTGGAVAQSGALTVTGSTRIDSGGAQIALTDAGNDFQAAVSLAGGNSSVRDRNALALGEVNVGALDVASGAGLDLGQGRIGGTLLARSGTAAAAAGTAAITAQALAVPLATTAGITQQGALTVVGSSVLDAGSGVIALTDAGNDFQGSVQARGGSIAIADRNNLAVAAQASDALRLQAGGQLATSGVLSAADIALSGGTGVVLGHDVGGGNVSLSSGGAIAQTAGSLSAARLSGNATGSATLTGSNNAIDVLGDFSAQGLDLVSNRTLLVSGRVEGGPSLRLRSGGALQLDGQLSGAASWLQAVAGIRQRAGSWIAADLLSGSAGGAVVLGDATNFIDNRIARLGNFTASSGFSLTNGGDLLLVLANGSSYSVDAGNSAMSLSVRGDLLQDGRAPLRNGTGTFAATGRIGTQQNPIYVIGSGTQTVAAVGAPPAYFNATTADGGLLDLGGGSGFNVPTSAFASRAQSSASRTVAFVDLSASGTPYRAFGLVRPGLRLPDDQQPACDAGDPDAVCSPE